MILHNDPLLYLYFGDARTCLQREFLMSDCGQDELLQTTQIAKIKKMMQLESLVLLKQTHSSSGAEVSDASLADLLAKKKEGDFLVTTRERTGLGVYTADCLPIIFYDTYNRAVGICHAGWIGSVDTIAIKTVEMMHEKYGTELEHLRIFFGPSAKGCCYEVTEEFRERLAPFEFHEQVLTSYGDQLYFDLPLFNRLQLEEHGIPKEAFHLSYNLCTICDESFCSNRRDKAAMQRQLTVVALK